ncbi:MAG TPA: hypothetical protein DC049_10170, partial [Spirochaetia bacterium]|nr:hypothetical protein [Spirochaetia bacterium]
MIESGMINMEFADRAVITTLIDNHIEDHALESRAFISRFSARAKANLPIDFWPQAEHGLALHITVYKNGKKHNILFDSGGGKNSVLINMKKTGINPQSLDTCIPSHCHFDHTGGFAGILHKTRGHTDFIANRSLLSLKA